MAVQQNPKDGKWYVVYKGKPLDPPGGLDSKAEAEDEQYEMMQIQQMGDPNARLPKGKSIKALRAKYKKK